MRLVLRQAQDDGVLKTGRLSSQAPQGLRRLPLEAQDDGVLKTGRLSSQAPQGGGGYHWKFRMTEF
jgi:hypothetical protein